MFPTEPKSVALWTGIYKAQQAALGIINEAYREVRETITHGDLGEYDGFAVLSHLNAATHAMSLAMVKAERELAQHRRDAKLPAEPEPDITPHPARVKNYMATIPTREGQPTDDEKKPEPPAEEVIDEGDQEVVDEQPVNEPVEPSPPPKPATVKAAKNPPGHVEQLVDDIKTELARFNDWAQYAAVFFDNKANDVDVLAGKVTDVRILSTILSTLKKLPAQDTKKGAK